MGFKRPLVRFQSLGPKKSPVTAGLRGFFLFRTLFCGIVTPLTSSKWEKRAFGRIIANGRKKRDMAPHRFNTASGMVRGDRDVC